MVAATSGFQFSGGDVIFKLDGLEKTSRTGNIHGEMRWRGGAEHLPLSLMNYLIESDRPCEKEREYYQAAEGSPPNRLFLSNAKPYQGVTPATLA